MLGWVRWVRLGFIVSVEGLLLGCWVLFCWYCIGVCFVGTVSVCVVSVKSFLASHFIWVSFSCSLVLRLLAFSIQ